MNKFLETFGDDYEDLCMLIDIYIQAVSNPELYMSTHNIDPEEERIACIKGIIEILDDSIDNEFSRIYKD